MTKILLTSLIIITSFQATAFHFHHRSLADENVEHIKNIYEMAITLSPEVLDSVKTSSAHPYFKMGNKYVPLNSGFWQLVQGWIRLYHSEINQYCPCDIDAQELVREAKDEVAKGFIHSKITRHFANFGEFVIVEAYGLSARYGKAALLLKASAEAAETILSIFVGGHGVHIICNVIDAMILFLFRKSQIYMRVFNNSKTLGQSRFLSVMRLAWLNRLMRRAQRRVFFYLQSAEIDEEALKLVSEEGAKREKRAKWVRNLSQKMSPILERIQEIDIQLESDLLSEERKKPLLRERRRLVKQAEDLTEVFRKSFFGKRYGWTLFLFSRKGSPQYLRGVTAADQMTSQNITWPLALQENVLERSLIRQAVEEGFREENRTVPLQPDEIKAGLAEEFIKKVQQANTAEHVQSIERILTDVEKVFDPSVKMGERFLTASTIESGLVGFSEYYLLKVMYSGFRQSTEGLNLWGRAKLRWRLERFIYYVSMYSDFLRTVALIRDSSKIDAYKYESMEAFLNLFGYLNQLAELSEEKHTKESLLAKLDQNLHRVKSFQPHLEKRTAYSWLPIPFRRPLPTCRSLVRMAR